MSFPRLLPVVRTQSLRLAVAATAARPFREMIRALAAPAAVNHVLLPGLAPH